MSDDILGRLSQIQEAMAKGDPTPAQVRKYEMTLCGLVGLLAKEETLAEIAFKKVLAATRPTAKSAADALMIAEAQPAYAEWRQAEMQHRNCYQMIMTCRNHGRSLDTEMRLQR